MSSPICTASCRLPTCLARTCSSGDRSVASYVRLYAATYPDDVAGMVLVDTTHEAEQDILEPVLTPEEREAARQLDFEGDDPEGFWTPEGLDALFAEMREARSASPLPPMRLVVLAAGQTESGVRLSRPGAGALVANRAGAAGGPSDADAGRPADRRRRERAFHQTRQPQRPRDHQRRGGSRARSRYVGGSRGHTDKLSYRTRSPRTAPWTPSEARSEALPLLSANMCQACQLPHFR